MALAVEIPSAQSGLLGMLVLLCLAIASVLLFRSMIKHIRKVPPTFDQSADGSRRIPRRDDRRDGGAGSG